MQPHPYAQQIDPIPRQCLPHFYYYPVEYGGPRHPQFAFTLCSEFMTVPPAHIVNWYLCAFNLYVSPLSVALQNYEPSRDLNPAKVTPKALPFSDSDLSDYETFAFTAKIDPYGLFCQSDLEREEGLGLFTASVNTDDRQTIETVNIYYLCLLTLTMFKKPTEANYCYWLETMSNGLKKRLPKTGRRETFFSDFRCKRLKPMFQELQLRPEFRAALLKSFIDLVFACRDKTIRNNFSTPFDYVVRMLSYSNMFFVPLIKTNVIDVSHPIRHASFIQEEMSLFNALQKHLDRLGRYRPYAKILNIMPIHCGQGRFPNLLAACKMLSPSDNKSGKQMKRIQKINPLLIPLLEAFNYSYHKWKILKDDQVLQMEAEVRDMEAEVRDMEAEVRDMEAEGTAMEAKGR